MSCDQDNALHVLNGFRDRLRQLIRVEPVLDLLSFLEPDQKERIKAKLRADGNINAVSVLIDEIVKSHNGNKGWTRELIDALETVGCKNAANYVKNNPPDPSEEAENDSCVRLIDLMRLTLFNMKTRDVCVHCCSLGLLTQEDQENIMTATENQGNIGGARLLLTRLVKNETGWFSKFLQALEDTEHHDLARQLRGEPEVMSVETYESSTVEESEQVCMAAPTETNMNDSTPSLTLSADNSLLSEDLNSSVDSSGLEASTVSIAENEEVDMYKEGVEEEKEDLTEDVDQSARQRDIVLRDYQMEVARPALEGKNIIICLPTGSGKTRVAVYITKEHLERKRRMGEPGKVAVLVNKVPLVEQHYKAEFGRFLQHQYSVERVSGASQLKISFPQIVEKNDIIICTAQILENSFAKAKNGDEDGINLSQFSLMVIDECHHTKKGGVYNHIMIRYLKQKHRNQQLVKQQKSPVPIPQILGLTASPGVGEAKTQQKAEEHILQICANLDAFTIKTRTLEEAKQPYKKIVIAEERKKDPFGDVIKKIMDEIHTHAELKPLCEPGTQNYEQWVVQKEQNAAKEENQKVRVCAEHLRQYNEALHQSNTIRMSDAFRFLHKYHSEELKTKSSTEDEGTITITDTERFLFTLFEDRKAELQELMGKPQYENNILAELKTNILKEFTIREKARGIIFTQTRLSTLALSQWIQENPKFDEVGVKASYLIGGGDQSVVKPMTAAEQKDVLNKFREGEINLLIATTVAEEGLDIAECNFVIRYGLVTNEISMIQARGRGRAEDSSYTLVAEAGSGVAERESVNEYREKMMSKAIAKVCKMNRADYEKKIREFQIQAIVEKKVKTKKKQQKGMMKESPSKISLSCRQCSVFVCSGEEIEIIENMHHVNVTNQFSKLFIRRENTSLQERMLDYETNGVIACKTCGQPWGSMMLYKSIECPCLHIKNFVATYGSKKKTFSKWSELAIRFPAFDYTQHADLLVEDSEDEDTDTD
ncbi:interferon-induced helicase C domain-containing protein 1-like isoform X2 [Myxocyprinus asiaticus]|uniref:interferon-induced helicase C domain-containing protein 1-like isoform X2 n=1 Tax=Myxocyprinus asiaticus TaxID=70543 RepID=UPI002223AE21|nr:interferon-induced helicase C domain-containing protein 1-like isoform X2 [Myxocyprinus asiaticus]